MRDGELARLVAVDLTGHLVTCARQDVRTAFALAVWAGDDYGTFAISIGTEEWFDEFRRVPALRDSPDEEVNGPNWRWWSGNWDTGVQPFLSPQTEELLAPLAAMTCDDSLPVQTQAAASQRWRQIGYRAVGLADIPRSTGRTGEPLFYAESPDGDCVDVAEQMLCNVAPTQFHAAIPAWRRLAETVRTSSAQTGAGNEADILAYRLRACGLEMFDVASGSGRLQRALAIADRT